MFIKNFSVASLLQSFVLSVFLLVGFLPTLHAQTILNAETVKVGGTTGANLAGDDNKSGSIPIGFFFQFYGQFKSEFSVNTNGVLFFGASNTHFTENMDATKDSLAVMWDDLESKLTRNADELIFYKLDGTAPNRKLIVQWNNYGIYNTNLPFGTIQAILYETSNVIQFSYISLLTPGRSDAKSALVAIRGANGSQVTHTFKGNPVLVTQGTSICWVPNGNTYTKSVITTANANCTVSPTQTLTNQTSPPPDKPDGLSRAGSVFSWNSAANAGSYTLVISTNSNLNNPIVNKSGINATSYDSGQTFRPGTTYYWVVRAVNSEGTTTSDLQNFRIPLSAPTAVDDSYSIGQDGVLVAGSARNLLDNDSDPQNDTLTTVQVSGPSNADSFTLNADGTFDYDPADTFAGLDTFTYKANDGSEDSTVATVRIQVTDANFAPAAQDDAYSISEDGVLTVNAPGLLANDTDIDVHDHLRAIKATDPANGSLVINADGSLTYTPTANFNGSDSATYKVNDGHLDSAVATIRFTVNPVNDAPNTNVDSYSVPEDGHLDVLAANGVLANDRDADGDSLTVKFVPGIEEGTVTLNPDGSFNYVPPPLFFGDDEFDYVAYDGFAYGPITTVNIRVNHVNHPPVGNMDSYSIAEDGSLTVATANGVLKNDADRDKQDHLSARKLSTTSNGLLHLNADGSFDYTPVSDFNGSDSFTYEVWDGTAASAPVTVNITVNAVNDPPALTPDSYSVAEDGTLTTTAATGVLANDTDADGDNLVLVPGPLPANGTVHWNADGSFTYKPNPDFNGSETFTYTAFDGTIAPGVTTVSVTVNAVNDAPVAADDSYSVFEDTALKVRIADGLLRNDRDIDGDALYTGSVTKPANGLVKVLNDGDFVYLPDPDFNGVDTFTYQVFDGSEGSNIATVSINVRAKNDDPIAIDDAYSVAEDGFMRVSVSNGVLANDKDVDADTLFTILDSAPANGALQMSLDGGFTYRPDANFNGTDTFTYFVNDGTANSAATATVTLTVNSVNDAPLAGNKTYTIAEDGLLQVPVSQGLLANDFDPDGDSLIALLDLSPADGQLQLSLDGSFTYKPNTQFNGVDTFTYYVNDGSADSQSATVEITVNGVNDKPLAGADSYSIAEDSVLDVPYLTGVLANDIDLDGDLLTAALKSGTSSGHLILGVEGAVNYRPNANFNGTDSFTYAAYDGWVESDVVTVTITVNAVNDLPQASDDSYSVGEDGLLTVSAAKGLLANDFDQDGDALTAVPLSATTNGTLHTNPDGSFTYQPNANFNGQDSFTYLANDGTGPSRIAMVLIQVNSVNDAPQAANDVYTVPEDAVLNVNAASGVIANDFDLDGDSLQAQLSGTPLNGTLQLNLDGSFVYTPNPGFNGADSFTYLVNDGSEDSSVVTVSITVSAVNDMPLAGSDAYSIAEDGVLNVDAAGGVLANDFDFDGDQLVALLKGGTSNGSLHLDSNGGFTYQPSPSFNGQDSFTYSAGDGALESAPVIVTINVNPVNDAPVAVADSYSLPEGGSLNVSAASGLLSNDTDIEGDRLVALVDSYPANGALGFALDGSFSYTPRQGFSGADSFSYHANDGSADSSVVVVSIMVNFVNTAPLAGDDAYTTLQNSSLNVNALSGVLANDSDPDGDQLIAIVQSLPSNGSLSLSPDGSFFYKPNTDFFGLDSFTYLASDTKDESSTVTVVIDVREDNQAPIANPDVLDMFTGETLVIAAPGVLANDVDPDGDPLSAIAITMPQNGTLHMDADGGFTYRPVPGFTGQVTFEYEVLDGHGGRSASNQNAPTTTVTINVQGLSEFAIPTLDTWGRMLMVLLMGISGILAFRWVRP